MAEVIKSLSAPQKANSFEYKNIFSKLTLLQYYKCNKNAFVIFFLYLSKKYILIAFIALISVLLVENICYRQILDYKAKLGTDLGCTKGVFKLPWRQSIRQKHFCHSIALVSGLSGSRSVAGDVTNLLEVV
jgi:hypothetical protein